MTAVTMMIQIQNGDHGENGMRLAMKENELGNQYGNGKMKVCIYYIM
jgi:hypothetical protein